MAASKLDRYREKRDFDRTAEPSGQAEKSQRAARLRFVIQKHDATRLHFDLRLEYGGVFKSWAVTKGPSLDPHDKRLAVEVEDHPLDYGDFEGAIPKGQYGGGTVQLWDRGFWAPEPGFEDVDRALAQGELKFVMEGGHMHGSWVLVRLRDEARAKRHNWLLIKHRDAAAVESGGDSADAEDRSIASGRTMAQIAAGKGKPPSPFMTQRKTEAKTQPPSLPDFIAPQLCQSTEKPPRGAGWVHEIKFDGYRMQLRISGGQATLLTRNKLDWSAKFPAILKSAAEMPDGIIDGEIVALDVNGAPDFAALQAAISDARTSNLIFFAFDLLFEGQEDLRPLPLGERKTRLKNLLQTAYRNLRHVDHFVSPGDAVLQSACRMHLEGIVSKRLDAPYRSGRSDSWVKSKCRQGHEVVIGGWTMTGASFRSLIAGLYRDGHLVHVGRIGTGYGRETVARLMPKLRALETTENPFSGINAPTKAAGTHWVKPELVAEIEYAGFTGDGAIRQAAFKGLREDKQAAELQADSPAPLSTDSPAPPSPAPKTVASRGSMVIMGVTLTHGEKPLWPEAEGGGPVTKRDLARYYEAVAPFIMPHIEGRPCSLIRMPDGIGGAHFFQRHAPKGASSLFNEVAVPGDRKPYLQIDRAEALIAAAQSGAVELHPWNCRPGHPDIPGRLVFDLDPAPDLAFGAVIDAALELRARLDRLGLVAFCKTTGGKGLHVVTPIAAQGIAWPQAKSFARELCQSMAADSPGRYLITMSKAARAGRLFLDYLRNDRLATAVAPFSPRGRPGALVSMPLAWSQVKPGLDPAKFNLRSVPPLLRKLRAWDGYGEGERKLAPAITKLGKS